MDLHLRIEDDLSGTIEIDLRADDDPAGALHLDYRRVAYDEVGGEALNARRDRMRRTLTPEAVGELRCRLPGHPLPMPANMPFAIDGAIFTLTIGRGTDAVEYTWGSHLPEEWECLRAIVAILLVGAGVSTYAAEYEALVKQPTLLTEKWPAVDTERR